MSQIQSTSRQNCALLAVLCGKYAEKQRTPALPRVAPSGEAWRWTTRRSSRCRRRWPPGGAPVARSGSGPRLSELVESKTENTEEDVTDEIKGASHPLGFPTKEPFAFPGLRSDIEAIEKGFYGSLGSFLDEAERMTNDFFKSFGFPSTHDRDSRPFPRRPAERHIGEGTAKKAHENEYSEFGSQITDV